MKFAKRNTDFLGTAIQVDVPYPGDTVADWVEEYGEDLVVHALREKHFQDARQGPKTTFRKRHAEGEDASVLEEEYREDVEGFKWTGKRGGGRGSGPAGMTKKAQGDLGERVAAARAEGASQEELEAIYNEFGL